MAYYLEELRKYSRNGMSLETAKEFGAKDKDAIEIKKYLPEIPLRFLTMMPEEGIKCLNKACQTIAELKEKGIAEDELSLLKKPILETLFKSETAFMMEAGLSGISLIDDSWDGKIHGQKRPHRGLFLDAIKGIEANITLIQAEITSLEACLKMPENQFKKETIEGILEEYRLGKEIHEDELERLFGLLRRLTKENLKVIDGGAQ